MTTSSYEESISAVDDHGRKVQSMFSDIAHGYDRANRLMTFGIDVRWRKKAVKLLAGSRVPTEVLDLCAGTLDSTKEIHRAYPLATLIGGDFSQGMLDTGARTLSESESRAIRPLAMDAHSLPLADRTEDAIFCAFGVRNLSDLAKATQEQARVLRPGGKLVVLEFFRPKALTTQIFHGVYNQTVLPVVGWACTGNMEAYRYLPRSISKFVTVEDYVALLRQNGFEHIKVHGLTLGVASIVEATRCGEGAT